jgi:hypothetical protein
MEKNNDNFYRMLFLRWLEENSVSRDSKINQYEGTPAYFLKPEQIAQYVNAFSPYDLYMKPNSMSFPMDYPTTAININAPWGESQDKNAILFPTDSSLKYGLNTQWQDVPGMGQEVYEHEVGHAKDLRTNSYKMWSFPNHGLTTWQGLVGGLLQREFPSMVREDKYRDNQIGNKKLSSKSKEKK